MICYSNALETCATRRATINVPANRLRDELWHTKIPRGVEPDFLCKKSLFYGHVESSFAVYDSVVLTGPGTEGLPPWRPSASPWAGISTMASPPAVEPGCWTDRVQV